MMCSSRCVNHSYPENSHFLLIVFRLLLRCTGDLINCFLAFSLSGASKEIHRLMTKVFQKQQRQVFLNPSQSGDSAEKAGTVQNPLSHNLTAARPIANWSVRVTWTVRSAVVIGL